MSTASVLPPSSISFSEFFDDVGSTAPLFEDLPFMLSPMSSLSSSLPSTPLDYSTDPISADQFSQPELSGLVVTLPAARPSLTLSSNGLVANEIPYCPSSSGTDSCGPSIASSPAQPHSLPLAHALQHPQFLPIAQLETFAATAVPAVPFRLKKSDSPHQLKKIGKPHKAKKLQFEPNADGTLKVKVKVERHRGACDKHKRDRKRCPLDCLERIRLASLSS